MQKDEGTICGWDLKKKIITTIVAATLPHWRADRNSGHYAPPALPKDSTCTSIGPSHWIWQMNELNKFYATNPNIAIAASIRKSVDQAAWSGRVGLHVKVNTIRSDRPATNKRTCILAKGLYLTAWFSPHIWYSCRHANILGTPATWLLTESHTDAQLM